MAATSKFPIISRKIVFAGNGVFSPETRARAFREATGQSIREIDASNDAAIGHDVQYKTFVDGRPADLSAARETSTILARWDLTPGVISYIDSLLANAGPVKTGAYRKSRVIYADGVEIDDPAQAVGAKEVMFMSLVPYARKIERGHKGYAPGAVYQAVAAIAAGRFGNVARIKFTYAEPEGAAPALRAWASKSAARHGRKQRQQTVKNLRQPAIVVYL